ncbi:MAG: hypothetical protein L6Q37_06810 [Bdellovibrionaceae bacterium]|nr:hypothetical protein [Pseudobdellovibrionaceae bacterium]NUM59000.1 hypothetical protein [Pseudobdellovibrionaceae bacterium]
MRKNKVIGKNLQQLSADTGIKLPNMTLLSLLKFEGQTLLAVAIKAEISDFCGTLDDTF